MWRAHTTPQTNITSLSFSHFWLFIVLRTSHSALVARFSTVGCQMILGDYTQKHYWDLSNLLYLGGMLKCVAEIEEGTNYFNCLTLVICLRIKSGEGRECVSVVQIKLHSMNYNNLSFAWDLFPCASYYSKSHFLHSTWALCREPPSKIKFRNFSRALCCSFFIVLYRSSLAWCYIKTISHANGKHNVSPIETFPWNGRNIESRS